MNPINRIAGALTGLFTGFLTVLMQIPYIYYVIGRDMKEAGYANFTASLTAMTLGTVILLPMILFIALNAVGTILLGIRKGWNEGITAAAMLPFAFHATSTGLRDHLPPISKGQGIFSKLQNDLNNLGLAGSTFFKFYSNHLKYKDQQKEKTDVVNKIRDLPASLKKEKIEFPLSEEEVKQFIEIMSIQENEVRATEGKSTYAKDPNYKKNLFLYRYLDSRCPITLEDLTELHTATIQTTYAPNPPIEAERTSMPITLEYSPPSGEKQVVTYNYDAFERWMFEQLENERVPYLHASAPATVNLADKDMKIYRGYYKDLDVDHIRRVIREWYEKKSVVEVTATTSQKTEDNTQQPSPEKTPLQSANSTLRVSEAKAGFLTALQKRNSKQSEPEKTSSSNTSPKPPKNPSQS